MKWLHLTMAVLLAAATLAPGQSGQSPNDIERPEERDSALPGEKSAPGGADGGDIREQVSPDGSAWPRPFVPTEKINADSAVSFPTDI